MSTFINILLKEENILQKWKRGEKAVKIAKEYKRDFNKQRNIEKKITDYEALNHVEKVILKYYK